MQTTAGSLWKQYFKFLSNLPELLSVGQKKLINDGLRLLSRVYMQVANKKLNIICVLWTIGGNFSSENIFHCRQIDKYDVLKRAPECYLSTRSIIVKVDCCLIIEPIFKQIRVPLRYHPYCLLELSCKRDGTRFS